MDKNIPLQKTQEIWNSLRKPLAAITYHCRAKYYFNHHGKPILAQVQKVSDAKFREDGWESLDDCTHVPKEHAYLDDTSSPKNPLANLQRATRRAKINAFDYIMCNLDLDLFVTFTYAPDSVGFKDSYEECYEKLRVWLSNRVQRNGLKYVLVPERTKRGDIHFHAIMNSDALRLERAHSAKTGRALTHNGKPLWNLPEWKYGFTSAEKIASADEDRRAVAKYIFKYMGKQMGQKIGGRYILSGGELLKPFYVYSDDETDFFEKGGELYNREMYIEEAGLSYEEWGFL